MTTGIQARERAIYDDVWALPQYSEHSPGERYVPLFGEFAAQGSTVLDAGCGSGKGSLALLKAGYQVAACDLTTSGLPQPWPCPCFETALWSDLSPVADSAIAAGVGLRGGRFDWVYCTDVLEHIPRQFTMLAVEQMLRVAKYGAFLAIATRSDEFGPYIGAVLHQTVEAFPWWRDNLRELGEIVEGRDLIGNAVFVVRRMR